MESIIFICNQICLSTMLGIKKYSRLLSFFFFFINNQLILISIKSQSSCKRIFNNGLPYIVICQSPETGSKYQSISNTQKTSIKLFTISRKPFTWVYCQHVETKPWVASISSRVNMRPWRKRRQCQSLKRSLATDHLALCT